MVLRDRVQAGRLLAERLRHLKGKDPVVLALPRGGVPVGVPIAEALDAPLDLLLVRKIGAPGQPELALGAVVEGEPPRTVVNDDVARALGVPLDEIAREAARQLDEIARRRRLWLRGRPAAPVRGRAVIVVDDGIATGATARAALSALERAGAALRVLAVPVAPRDTAEALRALCEEAVFLAEPLDLGSVGAFYADFHQLEDAEVVALLDQRVADRKSATQAQRPLRPRDTSKV